MGEWVEDERLGGGKTLYCRKFKFGNKKSV